MLVPKRKVSKLLRTSETYALLEHLIFNLTCGQFLKFNYFFLRYFFFFKIRTKICFSKLGWIKCVINKDDSYLLVEGVSPQSCGYDKDDNHKLYIFFGASSKSNGLTLAENQSKMKQEPFLNCQTFNYVKDKFPFRFF